MTEEHHLKAKLFPPNEVFQQFDDPWENPARQMISTSKELTKTHTFPDVISKNLGQPSSPMSGQYRSVECQHHYFEGQIKLFPNVYHIIHLFEMVQMMVS